MGSALEGGSRRGHAVWPRAAVGGHFGGRARGSLWSLVGGAVARAGAAHRDVAVQLVCRTRPMAAAAIGAAVCGVARAVGRGPDGVASRIAAPAAQGGRFPGSQPAGCAGPDRPVRPRVCGHRCSGLDAARWALVVGPLGCRSVRRPADHVWCGDGGVRAPSAAEQAALGPADGLRSRHGGHRVAVPRGGAGVPDREHRPDGPADPVAAAFPRRARTGRRGSASAAATRAAAACGSPRGTRQQGDAPRPADSSGPAGATGIRRAVGPAADGRRTRERVPRCWGRTRGRAQLGAR